MMRPMADFPDVNVWVALTAEDHPHHERADRYWQHEADASIIFSRVTAMGLVRVTSHQHTFGGQPLLPGEAWAKYQDWRQEPAVALLADPPTLEVTLTQFVALGIVTPRNWTDTYIAAFAVSGAHRLVSFDGGFRSFPKLNLLHLKP